MGLEEAIIQQNKGMSVHLVCCDCSVGICHQNPFASKLRCNFCSYTTRKLYLQHLKKYGNISFVRMGSLITKEMKQEASGIHFNYSNVKELKDITFHNVEIGFGAFSTFATVTRNVMPSFNNKFHEYIDLMLHNEVLMTLAIEKTIELINPRLIVFHNGRFNNFKPWYGIANNKGIDFIATETGTDENGVMLKNNFFNDIPHSYEALDKKTELAWKNAGDKRDEIGRTFFEKRRNAIPAGDKVYTKDQVVGLLPNEFDSNQYNIAIFNSSEDEFCAISKEYDESSLFENQFVALKTIFEHYKDSNDIHFYLRIHPNLKTVPFRSHTMLYDLAYDNVTIIPPGSSISSYSLMDKVEKVIVFNSTMGIESSYWGKPVIALCKGAYSKLGVVYQPKTTQEVFSLLDDRELKPIGERSSFYKNACFNLGYHLEEFLFLRNKINNRHGEIYTLKKFLGSSVLQMLVTRFILLVSSFYGNGKKYKNIARETF